jgi:flagellin
VGLSVNTNIAAMNAYRNLSTTNNAMSKSLERLSSGFRINRAADDAAGLAISEGLRSQIGGMKQAVRNTQDGTSVVQTAEGALSESTSILQRMRDLSVQASNSGSLNTTATTSIQKEIGQLKQELDRIASTTTFNGTKLLDGNFAKAFQVGANAGETIVLSGANLGGTYFNSVFSGTFTPISADITAIDNAVSAIADVRATFGAAQNRIEHTVSNLATYQENLSAAESRIRDVDMASEMVNFTKLQILSQSGTAMLAQANQLPQSVLKLLQ